MFNLLIAIMVENTLGMPTDFPTNPSKKKPILGPPSGGSQITELGRRLRTLEGRYTDLQAKTQVIEQNMIASHKRLLNEIKATDSDIREIKKDLQEIKERLLSFIEELQTCAKKEEVKVLQKYVHLWEPMNFITRNEFEDLFKEHLKKKKI